MESRLFASPRVKLAVAGVMVFGVFTGAAYAEALPNSVQTASPISPATLD